MGILNVTPDSFSDGGLYLNKEEAVQHALQMVRDGADIIDVGGESTRPGSDFVLPEEEIRRILPVIKSLYENVDVPISVDTYKTEVAKAAVEAGASIINNIMGTKLDGSMVKFAVELELPMILMHIRGTPKDMQTYTDYKDVVVDVIDELKSSIEYVKRLGLPDGLIISDPGIGFAKTAEQNLMILKRLNEFRVLGTPLLIGTSRKSFIGKYTGYSRPDQRIMGTAASVSIAIMNGANIVRVHDIKEMVPVVRLSDAVIRAGR